MNDYLLSVLLGVIEGLTEFLPISSTAHMRIVEALVKPGILQDPFWKMYTIVIQLGAVLCLPVYFRGRIARFLSTFPRGERGDRNLFNHPVSLTLIAFACTAGPAFLLSKTIGKNLESLYVMGGALVVGGVIMWVVDVLFGGRQPVTAPEMSSSSFATDPALTEADGTRRVLQYETPSAPRRTERVEDMTLWQAVWIGLVQVLSALFPGTSRSMATIAAGQVARMSRPSALEFSFFLSLPTMAAATLYDFYKTVIRHQGEHGAALPPVEMTSERWVVLAIGFVVSFVVAIAVVHWFMGWVRKRGFTPFAVYRIVFGAVVLVGAWLGKIG